MLVKAPLDEVMSRECRLGSGRGSLRRRGGAGSWDRGSRPTAEEIMGFRGTLGCVCVCVFVYLCAGGNWSPEDPGPETGGTGCLNSVTGGIHSVSACVCMCLHVHTSEAV